MPRAYVVAAEGSGLTGEDVEAWVAERVAPHKRLRGGVCFTDMVRREKRGQSSREREAERKRECV